MNINATNSVTLKSRGHPVMIVGAGRGGSALLEMFLEDSLVSVVAVIDPDPHAKGIEMARLHGIPTFAKVTQALTEHPCHENCLIYNLTHDDSVIDEVSSLLGNHKVTGGVEAKIFWQMVTNLRQIRREQELNQAELRAIIQNATDGIITINDRCEIQGFNPAAEVIFGYSQAEIQGRSAQTLIPDYFSDKEKTCTHVDAYNQPLLNRNIEISGMRKDGQRFPIEISLSEMSLGEQRYFVGIVRDITERKEAEKRIEFMAHHDFLTKLPNRALFQDRLEQAIANAARYLTPTALLLIDLDGFKNVNDTMGHDKGDELLIQVAERLRESSRRSDTVARLGGDEFALILGNLAHKYDAQVVADLIVERLSRPFELGTETCTIGCSIGIAVAPTDSIHAMTLIRQADKAMYQSKSGGKGQWTYWQARPTD